LAIKSCCSYRYRAESSRKSTVTELLCWIWGASSHAEACSSAKLRYSHRQYQYDTVPNTKQIISENLYTIKWKIKRRSYTSSECCWCLPFWSIISVVVCWECCNELGRDS